MTPAASDSVLQDSSRVLATTCQQLNPWLSRVVRIQQITAEAPGVATFDLVFEDKQAANEYRFRPGQFNMLYLPGIGESAISVSGDPNDHDRVPHTIRIAGNVTRSISGLAVGSSIGLRGPFGSHWPVESCVDQNVILVAGGIGLAPLRPVICCLLSQRHLYGEISILIGARDASGLLFSAEYEDWKARGVNVLTTVDQAAADWQGNIGVVTTLLDRMPLRDCPRTLLLTCGPEVMMWYTVQSAIRRGLKPEAIFVSLERNMNCAIGLCGHCQFGSRFICKDGPVFAFDRVASILKVSDL